MVIKEALLFCFSWHVFQEGKNRISPRAKNKNEPKLFLLRDKKISRTKINPIQTRITSVSFSETYSIAFLQSEIFEAEFL